MGKIILVDDDSIDRANIIRLLGNQYDILEAEDGSQFVTLVAQHKDIDCVLLDHLLPDMDSFAIIPQYPHLFFIIITGVGSETTAAKTMKLGAVEYFSKDDLSGLSDVVNRVVHERRIKRQQIEIDKENLKDMRSQITIMLEEYE